ncbi:hypothetical protein ARMSODRAFT_1037824 [Armillaria solidipes]|uniref:Uncharacterized protein n=1 Tax=Armillaria solidipes TaxID=1076256 RepID=A0A2H3BEK3_9AGAR|nr:hypothetical protein ARMSODRAFT_1037824 [Armillaria solidipes]
MLLQFSTTISIPKELSDLIIDLACSASLSSAASLSLVCRQCRNQAQGHLVRNTLLSPIHNKESPYLFFSSSCHLIPYVKTIRICQEKEFWPENMDKAIHLLSSNRALTFIADGVYIRNLLSLETDWSSITICRILGSVYTADELYAWLLHLTALTVLLFPKEGPNTFLVAPLPRTAPLPMPFSLDSSCYHTEYGRRQLPSDIKFSKIMHPCLAKLKSLELGVDDDVWSYVEQMIHLCHLTIVELDLKFHRYIATASLLETIQQLGHSNQIIQLTIDVAICSPVQSAQIWRRWLAVLDDEGYFPVLANTWITMHVFRLCDNEQIEAILEAAFPWDVASLFSPDALAQMIPNRADSNTLSTETADIRTSSSHLEGDVYFPSRCAAAAALTGQPTAHSIWRTAETDLLEQSSIVPPPSTPQTSSTPFSPLIGHQPRLSPFTTGELPGARTSNTSGAEIDAEYQVVDVGQAETRPVLQPVLQLPSNIASPFYYLQVPIPVVTASTRGSGENTAISNLLDAEDYQLVDPTEIPGYVRAARAVTSSETLHLDVGPDNVTRNDPIQGLYHWNRRTVEFFEIASRYDGEFPSRQANPNWQRETTEWLLNMYYLLNAMGPRERRLSDIIFRDDGLDHMSGANALEGTFSTDKDTPFNTNGRTSISTDRKQLAETLRDIAGWLDTGPPDKATRDLMADTLYSAWSLSLPKVKQTRENEKKAELNGSAAISKKPKKKRRRGLGEDSKGRVEFTKMHTCGESELQPTRSILNYDFLIAASLLVWPDLDPFEIADDEDEEEDDDEPDSQVTHLAIDGDFDNYQNPCPLNLLTRPLPLLHTLQLYSVVLKSARNLEYYLDDLKRLAVWDSHVSAQGLFLLLRSSTSLTHFALGGKKAQIIEDSDDPRTQMVVPPPSFPRTLQYLHLNICALVNWQGNSIENPLRPWIVSWLGHLQGPLSLTTLECKLFTNDVRLPRRIISLAEESLEELSLFFNAHQGLLLANREVHIYLLCKNAAQQLEMRQSGTVPMIDVISCTKDVASGDQSMGVVKQFVAMLSTTTQFSSTMITVSRKTMHLNMRHRCCEALSQHSRRIVNAEFLIAASPIVWPDLNPVEVAGEDTDEEVNEEPDSAVTHIVIDCDIDNFENSCPLDLLTRPLPLLHTVQLHSVALKSIENVKYELDDLKWLSIWDSHVSTQGLFHLLRSITSLTHFALGGKNTRVIEDSGDPMTQPVVPPPSLPQSLYYLHLNICALVNWQGRSPLRPRIVSWLGRLHGTLSLNSLECKVFTNDVRLPRNIVSLAEDTLQKLSFFFVETHIGSAFINLHHLRNLRRLDVLCVESRVADVVRMLCSITTTTFQQLSIYIPLTSFDLSFASLNTLNIAAQRGKLLTDRQIHIYLLCTNVSQQEEMKKVYSEIILGRLNHVHTMGRLTITWFFDDDFESKFRDCPVWYCAYD